MIGGDEHVDSMPPRARAQVRCPSGTGGAGRVCDASSRGVRANRRVELRWRRVQATCAAALWGLAEVRNEDLGFLLGDRRRGMWSITELGRHALNSASTHGDAERRPEGTGCKAVPKPHCPLSLRVACYWLVAWFMAEARQHGDALVLREWESLWARELRPADQRPRVRIILPAAAYISSQNTSRGGLGSARQLLLLPDLGTSPVARYGEVLRRLAIYRQERNGMDECELLVATPDPDGKGTRAVAWRELLARVAAREQVESPPVRVVNWSELRTRLGGSASSALVGGRRDEMRPTRAASWRGPAKARESAPWWPRYPGWRTGRGRAADGPAWSTIRSSPTRCWHRRRCRTAIASPPVRLW